MKRKELAILVISIMFLVLLLGTTKVNAARNTWVFGITESLDIATTVDTDPKIFGEYGKGEPAITTEDFRKIEIKELVRGKTYVVWDGNTANKINNCTLSVKGVNFGTLEQTNTKLWGDFQGDGDICAYILKVDKNAVLPTETSNGYYSIETTIEDWNLLLPSNVTLVNEETLKTNTITNNDNNDIKVGITGKISSNAKVVLNTITETTNEFKTMQTALTNHITKNFSKYDSKTLFVKDIKIENGKFDGKLTLTFDIGTAYNAMKFVVAHQKSSDNTMEYFNGIVTDGKATIEVTEFSPFAISVLTENNNEVDKDKKEIKKGEKDDTPKTGTTSNIHFLLPLTVVTALGTVTYYKKQNR